MLDTLQLREKEEKPKTVEPVEKPPLGMEFHILVVLKPLLLTENKKRRNGVSSMVKIKI